MTFTTLVDIAELGRLLQQRPRQVVLLDCRFDLSKPDAGRKSYADGHIPGARYVDLNENLAAPTTAQSGRHPLPAAGPLLAFFTSLGVVAASQVVAYDDANGAFAARTWWLLRWSGHSKVAVLDGGYRAWITAGGQIEAGDDTPSGPAIPTGARTGDLSSLSTANPEPSEASPKAQAVTAADVVVALKDPRRVLVDARAPERFAGDVEPIDPVAGHIPGAVNHPFSRNLDAENRFLPPDELRRRWLESLHGRNPHDAILMCGSGVTACHNALAMEIAGLSGAKLYAGSWSEWIRDPERPVARGTAP
jgi:thiosulfate/3-mercaptopyruvate sulfurtransferase